MENISVYSLIKQHYQQIDLFYYQNNREMYRPKTNYLELLGWVMLYILVIAMCVILNTVIKIPVFYEVAASIAMYSLVSEFLLKFIGVKTVECYQHYAKEETRRNCLCVPSCSEYAILCLRKYELIYALLKIRKRLFVTCRGYKYIIDNP